MREGVYLLYKHARCFRKVGIVFLFLRRVWHVLLALRMQALQLLDGQFHGRERVVYLMRDLPCHGAPCPFALGFGESLRRILHLVHQRVVLLYQCA